MKKLLNKSQRGGKREGAGRKKTGRTTTIVPVSVNTEMLKTALAKWGDGRSALFNKLLGDYVAGGKAAKPARARKTEAAR
jgi:hypothetical protein